MSKLIVCLVLSLTIWEICLVLCHFYFVVFFGGEFAAGTHFSEMSPIAIPRVVVTLDGKILSAAFTTFQLDVVPNQLNFLFKKLP